MKPAHKTALERINEQAERRTQQKPPKAVQGVLVEGMDNCLIKFPAAARLCRGTESWALSPAAWGYPSTGRTCPNYLLSLRDHGEDGRWIDVSWAGQISDLYVTLPSHPRAGPERTGTGYRHSLKLAERQGPQPERAKCQRRLRHGKRNTGGPRTWKTCALSWRASTISAASPLSSAAGNKHSF